MISRLLGGNRSDEAKKVCAFSFYGTVTVFLLYSGGCFLLMDPLLRLLGATDETILYATQYTQWVIVFGGIPTALSAVMAQLLRSSGYGKLASYGLSGGGLLNIALDPLFMFVIMEPGQEVTGAAIATAVSYISSCLYFLIVFYLLRKHTKFFSTDDVSRERLCAVCFFCRMSFYVCFIADGYGKYVDFEAVLSIWGYSCCGHGHCEKNRYAPTALSLG